MKLRLLGCTLGLAALAVVGRAEDKPVDPVAHGKELAVKKCKMCHAIDGQGGKMSPLNGIADGKTDEQLMGGIIDPKTTLGADTKMPSYKGKLTDDEVKAIIAYLKTLKK